MKTKTKKVNDTIERCESTVSVIAAKLISLALLLEGQGSSADGLTQLFGMGLLLREFGEDLEGASKTLDELSVALTDKSS